MPQRVEQHRRYPNGRAFRQHAGIMKSNGWEVNAVRSVPTYRQILRLFFFGGPRMRAVEAHYVRPAFTEPDSGTPE
jgi:hypothetical protein